MCGDVIKLVHICLGFAVGFVAQAPNDEKRRILLVAGLRDGSALHFRSGRIQVFQ
ncbi:hypothetical protein D3C87_2076580 [compost metagenome]